MGTFLRRIGLCAILLIALFSEPVHAQIQFASFVLYNIDTSAFPKVSASLYAIDVGQVRYRNFSASDIDLYENGQLKNPTLTMNCDTSNQPIPVAVCLTLDQSFSMANKTPFGDTYWDWVKFGAQTFIDSIKMVPPTCVAITSFGGNSYVRAPFQTIKPPLYAALDQIPVQGGTNYDEAFLNLSSSNQAAGAVTLLRNAPYMLRRYLIILTDGQPDKAPSKQRIIDSCLANGITVYAINLWSTSSPNINADLNEICTKTGGKAYLAHSKAEVGNIYKIISLEMQRNIDCRVSWISTPGCGQQSRLRNLSATLKKSPPLITWKGSYMASAYSVADPITSVSTISFDDPGSGNKVQKTFTIKAPAILTIRIDKILSSLPANFNVISTSKPLPTTLKAGESIDVVVEFTQITTGTLHSAVLSIIGSPCNQSVTVNVIIPVLKLESPVGGESLVGCDSIPIKWSGIAEDEAITVFYSWDNGIKWRVLDNHASGLQRNWLQRVEHDAGTDNLLLYKVKVERSTCKWLSTIGGGANDSAKSLCLNDYTNELGVGGSFDNSIHYGATTTPTLGKRDGFFAIMTQNGVQKSVITFGGADNDEVTSVDADRQGSYFVAGNSKSTTIRCGDSTLVNPHALTSCGFVACIDTLGKTLWCVGIGDSTGLNTGEFFVSSVHVKADSSVAVQGYQRGIVSSLYTPLAKNTSISFDVPNITALYFPVTVEISKKGNVTAFQNGFYYPLYKQASTTALFNTQTYQCGSFSGTMVCGQSPTSASGTSDAFVRAVSLNPGTDQSATSFSILRPLTWMEIPSGSSLDLPQVDVGQSLQYPAGQPIRNDGSRKLNLLALFTTGVDSADFAVFPPLAPGVIDDHANPELGFRISPRPVQSTIRHAYLVAIAECCDPAFIRLRSYAIFPNLSMTGTDFHRRRIGSINYDTMHILNKDPGAIPLNGFAPQYNAWNEFQWAVTLPSDSLIQGKSDIPIIVKFVPTHIEGDSLEVHIDSSAAVRLRVSGMAYGSGFLPRRASRGYHFQTVPRGTVSAEQGSVVIYNIDTLSKLRVYTTHWRNALSDDFHTLRSVPDTSIAPGDSIVIPVQYYPLTAGLHKAYFVFEHDAAPGPDPLPKNYDTVMVDADALELTIDSTHLRFPTILSCDSADLDFTMTNHAALSNITISNIILNQTGTNFSFSPTAPLTIVPGGSQSIHLNYNPNTLGPATAQLIIIPANGLNPDTLNVSAGSVTASLSIVKSDTSFKADIGSSHVVRIVGNLNSSTPFLLDSMCFAVQTNKYQARFALEKFTTNTLGWQWHIDSLGSTYLFAGHYTGPTLTNPIHFLDIPFEVYLSQNMVNAMSIVCRADNVKECLLLDSAQVIIDENSVCYTRGSSVQARSLLDLQIQQPDPSTVQVQYTLDQLCSAQVELYNSMGSCVLREELNGMSAGQHSCTLKLQSLAAGLYFCRLNANSQSEIREFVFLP